MKIRTAIGNTPSITTTTKIVSTNWQQQNACEIDTKHVLNCKIFWLNEINNQNRINGKFYTTNNQCNFLSSNPSPAHLENWNLSLSNSPAHPWIESTYQNVMGLHGHNNNNHHNNNNNNNNNKQTTNIIIIMNNLQILWILWRHKCKPLAQNIQSPISIVLFHPLCRVFYSIFLFLPSFFNLCAFLWLAIITTHNTPPSVPLLLNS